MGNSQPILLQRITKALVLLAVAICLPTAAARAAPMQTYHYLVFSNPTKGQEAEYNRWYDARHIPDVLSVPGFVSAERFRINAVQMYPGIRVAMPRYLVSYVIRTRDIAAVMAEVNQRLKDGRTILSPAFDDKGSLDYLYRDTTPFRRTTPDPTRGYKGARINYLHIVFTVPNRDKRAEFNSWYDKIHGPSMMKGPGYYAAQRAVLVGPVPRQRIEPSQAIAMFRLNLPANMPIRQAQEVVAPGDPTSLPILDEARTRGYSYRRITPEVMAASIRAARARARSPSRHDLSRGTGIRI